MFNKKDPKHDYGNNYGWIRPGESSWHGRARCFEEETKEDLFGDDASDESKESRLTAEILLG